MVWAAFFNFVAIAIFELKVAATVGKGIVDPSVVDQYVVFRRADRRDRHWNLITWYHGLPSSSSHALIGGLIGATVAKSGTAPLIGAGIGKTALFIVLSPLIGMLLGALLMVAVSMDLLPQHAALGRPLVPAAQLVSKARSTASAAAVTTRRRRWASSGCC